MARPAAQRLHVKLDMSKVHIRPEPCVGLRQQAGRIFPVITKFLYLRCISTGVRRIAHRHAVHDPRRASEVQVRLPLARVLLRRIDTDLDGDQGAGTDSRGLQWGKQRD